MFRIIRFESLMKYTIILTVLISISFYVLVQDIWLPNLSIFKIITISSFISIILLFILFNKFLSRKLWKILTFFNKSLFPDLNGTWEGVITSEEGIEFKIKAIIRQSLSSTEIDIHGESVKSITLETTPTIEKGQKKLYYIYHATPKELSWSSYNGSTLFDIRKSDNRWELTGHYYTDRKTIGRISLKQISIEENEDVSFY